MPLSVLGPGRRPLDRYRQAVVNHVRENGMLHTYGGVDVWAWDSASGPLVKDVPTFVFGRGKYDNWLTHQAIEENVRAVVDVSEACTVVHVRHDHHLVVRSPSEMDGEEGSFWNFDARSKFELFINSFLAVSHGTYAPQMGTIMHAPLKLTSCFENDGFCIFQRVRPSSCRCEHSPYVGAAQNDPFAVNDSRVIFCGMLSNNYGDVDLGAKRWPITGRVYSDTVESSNKTGDVEDMTFGLPLVLEDILRIIARTDREKIILVVADFTERALVMEVVCSIRAVSVFPWLVIAALDDDMYRFCITRGLPVYLSEFDDSDFTDHANFRQLARFQIMFEIMKLGRVVYNIEPGSVFRSSPWSYSNKLKDAHMGILGRLPKSSYTNKNDEYVPASVVFVRPSKQTFGLLKEVMVHLRHHNKNVGRTLISLACAVDDENVKKMQSCRNEYGVRVHMFDSQLFRPMEKAMCPYCSDNVRPIVSYSGLFDSRGKVEDAVKVLRERGLSMTENGLRYCI